MLFTIYYKTSNMTLLILNAAMHLLNGFLVLLQNCKSDYPSPAQSYQCEFNVVEEIQTWQQALRVIAVPLTVWRKQGGIIRWHNGIDQVSKRATTQGSTQSPSLDSVHLYDSLKPSWFHRNNLLSPRTAQKSSTFEYPMRFTQHLECATFFT